MGLPWDTALWGTWVEEYGTKIVITNNTYAQYYGDELNYSGEIVDFSNNSFNAGESSDYDDYGYLLVELTESSSTWTPVGTCFVLRWENMETIDGVTSVLISEGFGAETFTDTTEALAGMTAEDGYFNYYSTYTESEE
jgi:hypothetical protein